MTTPPSQSVSAADIVSPEEELMAILMTAAVSTPSSLKAKGAQKDLNARLLDLWVRRHGLDLLHSTLSTLKDSDLKINHTGTYVWLAEQVNAFQASGLAPPPALSSSYFLRSLNRSISHLTTPQQIHALPLPGLIKNALDQARLAHQKAPKQIDLDGYLRAGIDGFQNGLVTESYQDPIKKNQWFDAIDAWFCLAGLKKVDQVESFLSDFKQTLDRPWIVEWIDRANKNKIVPSDLLKAFEKHLLQETIKLSWSITPSKSKPALALLRDLLPKSSLSDNEVKEMIDAIGWKSSSAPYIGKWGEMMEMYQESLANRSQELRDYVIPSTKDIHAATKALMSETNPMAALSAMDNLLAFSPKLPQDKKDAMTKKLSETFQLLTFKSVIFAGSAQNKSSLKMLGEIFSWIGPQSRLTATKLLAQDLLNEIPWGVISSVIPTRLIELRPSPKSANEIKGLYETNKQFQQHLSSLPPKLQATARVVLSTMAQTPLTPAPDPSVECLALTMGKARAPVPPEIIPWKASLDEHTLKAVTAATLSDKGTTKARKM